MGKVKNEKKISEIVHNLEDLVKILKEKTKTKEKLSKETSDLIKEILKEFKPKQKEKQTLFGKVKRSITHFLNPKEEVKQDSNYRYPHFAKVSKLTPAKAAKILEGELTPQQKRDISQIIENL